MLNAPRTIPYAFRVVEIDNVAWLYDNSERTYICSANATIWAEPLYYLDHPDQPDELPDSTYWGAWDIERRESFAVPLNPDDIAPDVDHQEAWDAAREEAHANCLI